MTSATLDPAAPTPAPTRSHLHRTWDQLWADRMGRIGLLVTVLVTVAGIAGALGLTPYGPVAQHPTDAFAPPSGAYWFGTDQFGRDIFSRMFVGLATTLRIAVLSVAIAAVIGTLAGVAAGFFGKLWDTVIGGFTDVLFAFPALLLALTLVAALGPGWFNTVVAIAVVYVPIFVRVARGPTLAVRELDFVKAGRVLGFSSLRLLLRHILPNVMAPVIVQVALALSWAILTAAGLSFLGLGVQPPNPALGLMINDARQLVTTAWWAFAFPAAAIVVAVIGVNLLGDGLRAALDPKGHQR